MAGKKSDRNPFLKSERNPYEGENPFEKTHGGDPFEKPTTNLIRCPTCGNTDPDKLGNRNTPSQILRNCLVCGNQWSGGNVGGLSSLGPAVQVEPMEEPAENDRPSMGNYPGAGIWSPGDE